jgi:hypothetical protein
LIIGYSPWSHRYIEGIVARVGTVNIWATSSHNLLVSSGPALV